MRLLLRHWHTYTKITRPPSKIFVNTSTDVFPNFDTYGLEMQEQMFNSQDSQNLTSGLSSEEISEVIDQHTRQIEEQLQQYYDDRAYEMIQNHLSTLEAEAQVETNKSNSAAYVPEQQKNNHTDDLDDYAVELNWQTAAPFIMLDGYKYLEPINRQELAKQKLKAYEQSLKLSLQQHVEPRLTSEQYVKTRLAELHLHRMAPLTPTLMKQGVNFLNAHVFTKLFAEGNTAILKELLGCGAFQTADFIDRIFLFHHLPAIMESPRYHFLLNILAFQKTLLPRRQPSEVQKKIAAKQGKKEEKGEQFFAWVDPDGMQEYVNQALFGRALGMVTKNLTELNRLRIFWSIQKRYFKNEDFFEYIIEELSHLTFSVPPTRQAEVTREVKTILTSAYSHAPFEKLLMRLFLQFPTFHEYITSMGLTILTLSKLRAISRLLPEGQSNQLHPIFQMIEFNLPKEMQQTFMLILLEMLSHEDHSRIEYQNLKRSYNHWLKDYTQPLTTKYHSALSRLLLSETPLTILYRRSANVPLYAQFSLQLKRNKQSQKSAYYTQTDNIKSILRKDYQPVLDNFVTTYELTAGKDLTRKLRTQIKKADKTLVFQNPNEQALYKLKAAHNIFFNHSLPSPSSPLNMQPRKQSYNAEIAISNQHIAPHEHNNQFRTWKRFQVASTFGNRSFDEMIKKDVDDQEEYNAKAKAPPQGEVQAEAEAVPVAEGEVENAPEEVEGAAVAQEEIAQQAVEGQEAVEEGQVRASDEADSLKGMQEKKANDEWNTEDEIKLRQIIDRDDERRQIFQILYFSDDVQATSLSQMQSEQRRTLQQQLTTSYPIQNLYRSLAPQSQQQLIPNESDLDLRDTEDEIINNGLIIGSEDSDQFFSDYDYSGSDDYEEFSDYEESSEDQKIYRNKKKPSFFHNKRNSINEENRLNEEDDDDGNRTFKRRSIVEDKPKGLFSKKNRFGFCTTTTSASIQPSEIASFSFSRNNIQEYRKKSIDKSFIQMLSSEQHVSHSTQGTQAAHYLFLHGRNEEAGWTLRPNKTLKIEFTSVVGTRAKDYQRFVRGTLFRYALPENLYFELLSGQLQRYNRYQFKSIVAHMVVYCDWLSDKIIEAICLICQKERIGYSFVEIAQLIKANDVRISPIALKTITDLWQRFDVINQDLLSFLRDYTRRMQIPISTEYYAAFCKSLILTRNFAKLQIIANAILQDIRPRPFKLESGMGALKGEQVAVLERQWKAKEQENYQRLYLQLIEVIVVNLDNTVPQYLSTLFDEYTRLRNTFTEKEMGYAFVCYALKREKVEALLTRLDNEPEKGTSFMYDCLLQTLLSNFDMLEDLTEKMLDVSVLKNRVVLTHEQIMRTLIVAFFRFSSNSFSKFLDHCLRFQETISESAEIKRQMFYILNNNVEDVSVGGIFNLLDFIFNEKRKKERIDYRAIKLSQEEKAKKLSEIQKSVTKTQPKKEADKTASKKEKKGKSTENTEPVETKPQAEVSKEEAPKEDAKVKTGNKKEEKKKLRREKADERERQVQLLDQIMAEQQALGLPQTGGAQHSDQQFITMIKSQSHKHESAKRKSLQSFGCLFEGSLEMTKEHEQAAVKGKQQKKSQQKPKDSKDDKKKKGKK